MALGRAFPELPPKVLAAVERHTLGAVDMSDLDMIVYIADALEPGRKGKMVQKLREKVGELELRDLFLEVYAYWVQLIMERRHPMYSKTTEIWNSYMPEQEVYRRGQPRPGTLRETLAQRRQRRGELRKGRAETSERSRRTQLLKK